MEQSKRLLLFPGKAVTVLKNTICSFSIYGLQIALNHTARKFPSFRSRLKEKELIAQIKLQDDSLGRWFQFRNGNVTSKKGVHPSPDVVISMRMVEAANKFFRINRDQLKTINALKNSLIAMQGPDELTSWFTETLSMMLSVRWKYGLDLGGGVKRFTSNTNGGPVFVYVKNDRIVRITPIEFDAHDARPWTIQARGKFFTPPRKTTISPHTLAWKSMIYSKDRLLYPMKRVDFDPNGKRNCGSRGISGYERIGWDEAIEMVANEIKRVKRKHGPGAIMNGSGSHHTWGNLGYWLSARMRFFNTIGWTPIVHNPDSWEGWYWGAMHHWGHSMRLGGGEAYGTVEDCLKHCEMVVFWSSDPEATSGVYGAFEGTIRRQWLKELGIKMVHIDPYFNHTAALLGGKWLAPRPATSIAMALAIAYVWITEELYDKDYVAKRTEGFDKWKAYILGEADSNVKTPEWQEAETEIAAKDVRALARQWGTHKTYLAAGGINGFGGACRSATGTEWARSMVCLMAMQGLGKPGVNFGGMQQGTPLDYSFFFPGYAEGGLSGDIAGTALAVNMYQRMPNCSQSTRSTKWSPDCASPKPLWTAKPPAILPTPRPSRTSFWSFAIPHRAHRR
jgi:trimethylamine-N-oxide reductase (cytochrome c)